jgi:hypothetical protein
MARRDRQCLCCGTKYSYCPTCGPDKLKPTWMTEFCSESCKELFETATKYNLKKLTKDEAKNIVEKLELKEKSAYVDCVQKDLENILAEEAIVNEIAPIVKEEPVIIKELAPIVEKKPEFVPKKKQKSHEVVKKEYK